MTGTVEFLGEQFTVAEKVSDLAILRFAKMAQSGMDSSDFEAMAVMYDLLVQVIAPTDWSRFERHADAQRADGDDLFGVIQQAFEVFRSRPSGRPSDSSGGPQNTEPSSTVDSPSPVITSGAGAVIEEYNRRGRPDLALVVRKAQEARQTA